MERKRKSPVALARSVASPLSVFDVSDKTDDTTPNSTYQDFTETDELLKRFAPKRERSVELSQAYGRLGYERRADRVAECGSFLEFAHEIDNAGDIADRGKLHAANFCRDRLCPMCSWRRSLKIYGQVSRIMECLVTDYKWLFLTLTVRNVPGELLIPTLSRMLEALHRYFQYAPIKAVVRGYFRALEITYNEETDTYHPHFHIILAVPKSYGKGDCYIKQSDWLKMWQKAYKDQNITQVYVEVAKPQQMKEQVQTGAGVPDPVAGMAAAIAEIAKYPLKDTDLKSDKVVYYLANALHGRRLVAYGGILKDMFAFLKMEDAESEEADLIHIEDPINADVLQLICRYGWSCGAYKLIGTRIQAKGKQ